MEMRGQRSSTDGHSGSVSPRDQDLAKAPHLTQELGNAAGMFNVGRGYACMSEEAVIHS